MAKQKSANKVEAVAVSDAASLSPVAAVPGASDVSAVVEAVAAAPVVWKVVKTTRAYLFGQSVLLGAGKVLAVASYGEAAIQRLKDQGVELEPV